VISVTLGNSRITQEKHHKEIGGLEGYGEGLSEALLVCEHLGGLY